MLHILLMIEDAVPDWLGLLLCAFLLTQWRWIVPVWVDDAGTEESLRSMNELAALSLVPHESRGSRSEH